MADTTALLIFTACVALLFDLVNGFHDAANSIATVVSTRVLSPKLAVLWAAFFNFIAMFIFAPKVADTISKIVKIEMSDPIYIDVILAGLLGAIAWDLMTWWFGLPTSSSHALIGGFAGAGVAYLGWEGIEWDTIKTIAEFIILAPLIGFALGAVFMLGMYWLLRPFSPGLIDQYFRKGQFFSAALYSLGHGANDAQKTMGILMALLLAGGLVDPSTSLSLSNPRTAWIILSCHAAMALGTALGGWKIVQTMGMKITKLKPMGGFCAETAGALTIFFATYAGIPVSTTQTITGAIMGVGSCQHRLSAVKWGVAGRIVWTWVLTLPAAFFMAALTFYLLFAIRYLSGS